MQSLARSCLLCLAVAATCSYASAPDPALIGCWRAAKIVLHTQDGSRIEDTSGRCTLQFTEEQVESICGTANGTAKTTYRYRIDRPNFYVTTMAGSTFRTDLIGSTRDYEYHVEGDRLVTVTKPPGSTSGAPVRVESEATRAPCP